ncbi:MAG: hypothetical protein QW040_02635 [Candidatus Aenigmatarchaeota archaeon]
MKFIKSYELDKNFFKKRIFSILISSILIFLILSSKPLAAFVIDIKSPSEARGGETISFPIEINTNAGELIPIANVTLKIEPIAGTGISCNIELSDGETTHCQGINVTTEFVPPMGYGYGYGYGYWEGTPYYWGYGYGYGYGSASATLRFNVRWKVPITPTTYKISLTVYANGDKFSKNKTIEILPPEEPEGLKGKDSKTIQEILENIFTLILLAAETDTSLGIVTNATVSDVNVNVTTFTGNITPGIPGLHPVKFLDIRVSPELGNNLAYVIINVSYTHDEVAGLDESTLRLYKWNGTSWNALPCPTFGCVDTVNNFVYANVTSFSLFGMFGSSPAPTTTTTTIPPYIPTTTTLPTTTTTLPTTTTTLPTTTTTLPTTTTTIPIKSTREIILDTLSNPVVVVGLILLAIILALILIKRKFMLF